MFAATTDVGFTCCTRGLEDTRRTWLGHKEPLKVFLSIRTLSKVRWWRVNKKGALQEQKKMLFYSTDEQTLPRRAPAALPPDLVAGAGAPFRTDWPGSSRAREVAEHGQSVRRVVSPFILIPKGDASP